MRHATLKFAPRAAGLTAGMLQRAAVGLMIPAIFKGSIQQAEDDLSPEVTDAMGPMAGQLGLSPMVASIIPLAVVGSAAEISDALASARRNQFDRTLGIAVGSSL